MSSSIETILARGADVERAAQSRQRLMWAWGLQWVVLLGMFVSVVATGVWGSVLILGGLGLALMGWAAVEVWNLQSAIRDPIEVRVRAFIGMLTPISSQILAVILLIDTGIIDTLARRMQQNQCVKCGYDLRGLPSARCPECGSMHGRAVRP